MILTVEKRPFSTVYDDGIQIQTVAYCIWFRFQSSTLLFWRRLQPWSKICFLLGEANGRGELRQSADKLKGPKIEQVQQCINYPFLLQDVFKNNVQKMGRKP